MNLKDNFMNKSEYLSNIYIQICMQIINKHFFSDKLEQWSTLLNLLIFLRAKVGDSISLFLLTWTWLYLHPSFTPAQPNLTGGQFSQVVFQ